MANTWAKKNDNFSHFPKHRFIKKKPFCCNSPSDQKLVFLNFAFLKPKTLMLNKNITKNEEKAKIRKRDWKEKSRQETKRKINYFRKNKLQLKSFMLFFS